LALISFLVFQNVKLLKIANNIEELFNGNFNHRIMIRSSIKPTRKLIINMNRLIDEIQRIVCINKQYEEDRKKMISNISHDFRTPLTSMLGYLEMLRTGRLSDQEVSEYLDIVNDKGIILRNLIEEFYVLSKIDSEDIILEIKKLNITEVMRQCILSFLKDFEQDGIVPVIEIPDKDIFINADEKAIFRILQNIIANGLKYGSEGKTLGVALIEKDNHVVIEIWDKGRGIPPNEIQKIFDRLYTVEKSRNSKLKGSGIGLTIVKDLVYKHKGSIEVESVPYEKTIFRINLPKS
jgi:signal transduction histidine kinase